MCRCWCGQQLVIHLGRTKLSDCWVVWQASIWFCKKLLDHLACPPATNECAHHFTSSPALGVRDPDLAIRTGVLENLIVVLVSISLMTYDLNIGPSAYWPVHAFFGEVSVHVFLPI